MFYLKDGSVSIREFTEQDIENKVEWINDSENNTYLHYDLPLSVDKTLEWFKNKQKNRLDCVIEYDGTAVGLVGLIGISDIHKKAEFYISMGDTRFKRKGIGSKATMLLLKYAFEELKLNKVFLNVDEENTAACNLYEKIGFVQEGLFVQDMMSRGKMINRVRYAIFRRGVSK